MTQEELVNTSIHLATANIDLGDVQNFQDEHQLGSVRNMTVVIKNNTATEQTVCISNPYFLEDGVLHLKDGEIATGLTAHSNVEGVSIDKFLAQSLYTPMRVLATTFESNNTQQLNKSVSIKDISCFGDGQPERIPIGMKKDPRNNNNTLLHIDRQYSLDFETDIRIPIPAKMGDIATETTITFYIGAMGNSAKGLYNTAKMLGARVV
jgi:hypothetical protein